MQRIGDQLTPLVLGDAAREEIGIEGRLRHHRQHAAVVGIHHDDGTLLIAHRLLGGLLQAEIERQVDVGAGHLRHLVEDAQLAAEGVDLDLLSAVLTA